MSAREVAELRGVHEATVRRACARRELPSMIVDKRYVILYGDARRWAVRVPGRPEGSVSKKKTADK